MYFGNNLLNTERDFAGIHFQITDSLFQKDSFTMFFQMFQVSNQGIFTFGYNLLNNHHLIVFVSFTFFNRNRSFRAMAKTGSQSVTHQFANEPGLSIYNLQCTFVAVRNTNSTSVTFIFINIYNFAYHIFQYFSETNLRPIG